MSSIYVGIDVAKDTLVVGAPSRHLGTVDNTPDGHRQLLRILRKHSVELVTLESTGIYGKDIANYLREKGLPVATVAPDRVRYFAKSIGQMAKTDPIDAQVIAEYGRATNPRLDEEIDERLEQIRALTDRRQQVVSDRVQEQNRREACRNPIVCKLIDQSIAHLKEQEKQLNKAIKEFIKQDEELAEQDARIQTVGGIGPLTSAAFLAHVPELGSLNRQQIAKLIGLAPMDNSSGQYDGMRRTRGGRTRMRSTLYLATWSAIQYNPIIKEIYKRLIKKGKAKNVAIIACARKILVRVNSLMKEYYQSKLEKDTLGCSGTATA